MLGTHATRTPPQEGYSISKGNLHYVCSKLYQQAALAKCFVEDTNTPGKLQKHMDKLKEIIEKEENTDEDEEKACEIEKDLRNHTSLTS